MRSSLLGLPVVSYFLIRPQLLTYVNPSPSGGPSLGPPQHPNTCVPNWLHLSEADMPSHSRDATHDE
jgi:hypothetical protein